MDNNPKVTNEAIKVLERNIGVSNCTYIRKKETLFKQAQTSKWWKIKRQLKYNEIFYIETNLIKIWKKVTTGKIYQSSISSKDIFSQESANKIPLTDKYHMIMFIYGI